MKKAPASVKKAAEELMKDPHLLFKAGQKIGSMGVVGEERNVRAVFLGGLSRSLPTPASIMAKGSTSSGKTTLEKSVVELFPPECVIERSSLSAKALVHGKGSLNGKIFFLHEYRGGKDAQYLMRLSQSDGIIGHEFTQLTPNHRGTEIVVREGTPVVLTTTTERKVYEDDETRFLSIWADESPDQNLAIVRARAAKLQVADLSDLPQWQLATGKLICREGDFSSPPAWLDYVATKLPVDRVRVRRDWARFLTLLRATSLCSGRWRSDQALEVEFADYCVAYRILEPIFAATLQGVRTQELQLSNGVRKLNKKFGRAVTTREIAEALGWKESLVYKYLPRAEEAGLLKYEQGTREKNVKRVTANPDQPGVFLPTPRNVFTNNPDMGAEVRFIEPFVGGELILSREQ